MEIHEIISKLIERDKLTQLQVSRAVGIDQSQFSKQLKIDADLRRGEKRVNFTVFQLRKLEKYFNFKLLANDLSGLSAQNTQIIIQNTDRYKTFHKDFANNNYVPVPLLADKASAGSPAEINERDVVGYCLIYAAKEWMPGDPENYTCVKIRGKSMYPIIDDGDIVAIDHNQRDPRKLNGKITAFRKDGGVTIKWLKVLDNKTVVGVPQNIEEELDTVINLSGDEIEGGIVGRVAWWWAKR